MDATAEAGKQPIFQSLLLHAHLPYVRHPDHPQFFEENWLFEAISECYLPLIDMLQRLYTDNIPGRITFTLTPTLTSMLQDDSLIKKYSNRLRQLCKLTASEAVKHTTDKQLQHIRYFYQQHFAELRHLFEDIYNRDLISQFKDLRDKGKIEIIGCAATHALLALTDSPRIVRSQIKTGLDSYCETFGDRPRGIWMPECAYTPLVSEIACEEGIEYSIVDSHGILHSTPMPKYSVFAPVTDCNGLILFGRDPESSKQVWSADTGYPGDYNYREFYRDLGWDGKLDDIGEYLVSKSIRHDLGLKYYRITGNVPLEEKEFYHPETARIKAAQHAEHFVFSRLTQGRRILSESRIPAHILSPYDAELFGHWWFEGPIFLEEVLRQAAATALKLITPADYLDLNRELQKVNVSVSSWGNNGYFETWLNGSNDWIYRELRKAEAQMEHICRHYCQSQPDIPTVKALNQAARELLLAQASDWAFILTTDTTTEYATHRVKDHLNNFNSIMHMLDENKIDLDIIHKLYQQNNIFPNIDYSVFA